MALTTTWTARDALAFTAGTLSTITNCVSKVESQLHRGTLSSSTTPTSTQVQEYLIHAKQKLMQRFGFSWRRNFVYAATVASTWQYALPSDFGGGGTILRDITQDIRLDLVDPLTFDTLYPDPAGSANAVPTYYTIKDRELWLSAPADGVYTLELEYPRTGEDSTSTDVSYLPESARFMICDYATARSYMLLQQFEAAQGYMAQWNEEFNEGRRDEGSRKWAAMNFMAKNWHYKKI